MNLYGTLHSFLPGVLAITVENNREIVASGDLDRAVNDGHECHLFNIEEIRALLLDSGVTDFELHANGWLIPNSGVEIPESDPVVWQFLFEAELRASRESPGAGTHIIAWGRLP
jgi:hypothetical protein